VCAAADRGCGTATGWRNKGRCPACRAAHNEDTARRRRRAGAPPAEAVDRYIALLQAGTDPTEAARTVDIHPRKAASLAQDDPRVAAALDSLPESKLARQAAYLTALLARRGVPSLAQVDASVTYATVTRWREDPVFDAAQGAIRKLFTGRAIVQRAHRPVSEAQYEAYLNCLQEGATHAEAARRSGCGKSSVGYRAAQDPEFAARLHAIRRPVPRRRKPRAEVDGDALRAVWADTSRTIASIAAEFRMTSGQVSIRAREMGLPPRKGSRRAASDRT
jgi:hypothetical protein